MGLGSWVLGEQSLEPGAPSRYDPEMSVSSDDLFGSADGAMPAEPGSYGQAPSGARLPESTRLGPVRLQVADLDRSREYYEGVLGLRTLAEDGEGVSLGPVGAHRVLVELVPRAGATAADSRPHWGLYHFAILLPDRASLGRFVAHLGERGVRAGAGDHLVSEAFYLRDPDGLGIEVYADRPRSTWQRLGRELMLATDAVDVRDVVRAGNGQPWTGMPADTVMGHVHLHVGDVEQAGAFYGDTMGFDRITWRYPGALFLGAGGYHHHVGTNTWAGPRATAPRADEAQLLAWTMELPDEDAVTALARNLEAGGYQTSSQDTGGFHVRDPWGTTLRVRAS